MTENDRLDSWKAIAEYLGRDRSTVVRWERESGLPVRRVPGGRGRSVFAYRAEIDEWLASAAGSSVAASRQNPTVTDTPESEPAGSSRRPVWIPIALVLGTIAVVVISLSGPFAPRSPGLLAVSLDGQSLVGTGPEGRVLWRFTPPAVDGNVVAPVIRVGDIDGDGRPDVIAAMQYLARSGEGYGEIVRLDEDGRLLWAHKLEDRYEFGDTAYGPGWYPEDVMTYRADGEVRIAAAFHHHTWWPSVVTSLDAGGRAVGRFVHAGWVTALNLSADGRWLLASGISNAHGGAMVAALRASDITGSGPMAGGSLPECRNCPEPTPDRYVVVPWSDLARPSSSPRILVLTGASGTIEMRAVQRPVPDAATPELIVAFSASFDVLQRNASDGFAETHAMLERSGELTHPFAMCPWKTPLVRMWTPADGWRDVP